MSPCIQEPELSQFVQGKLPRSRAEEISFHIDDCQVCQDTVVAISGDDTFVGGLRAGDAVATEPREPAFRHGLQRLLSGFQLATALGAEQPTPQQIGPYVIEAKLGDGGMGTVFRAQHSKLKRTVALKVLPSHRWSNAQAIARFEREMEAIGQLDHPHIVRASDAGEDQGMHYLVMEYVDGLDLARLAKRLGPLPVADACELARQAAIGLQHAHASGLVHRDVKPSNLMLAWERAGSLGNESKPTLKILDLGLALLGDEHLREEHDVTTVGALMGTLDYMSPEQGIDSHSVDHRADIYGLGATLFKLLTGRAPYADPQYSTLLKKMTALATKAAPSLGKVRPDLPANVVSVVDKMLARDPDERFASAQEAAEALAEPAQKANLGSLLRKGLAAEDPETCETNNTLVRLHEATATQSRQPVGRAGQGGTWKKWLVVGMLVGVLGVAGAVFRIATDYGEIVIESPSGDLQVNVKRQDKTIKQIQLESGKGRTRVRSGIYEIEVIGEDAELVIKPNEVNVQRRGVTTVNLKPRDNTAAPSSSFALQDQNEQNLAAAADEPRAKMHPDRGLAAVHAFDPAQLPVGQQPDPYAPKPFYRVRAGDVLGVYIPGVLGNESYAEPPTNQDDKGRPLSLGFPIPVREDGSISLPLISHQKVAGKSIPEIEAALRAAYTQKNKILEDRATIMVSIIRKADELNTSIVLSADIDGPRYEGRTLGQWLNEVKFECSPKRLTEAMQAAAAMIDHPDNSEMVDETMDAIFGLMRESGQHPSQSGKLSEHAWRTLIQMPLDDVADRIVVEIEQGTAKSRQFLFYVWQPTYAHTDVITTSMTEAVNRLRSDVAERSDDVLHALNQIVDEDTEFAVNYLFQLSTQSKVNLEGNMDATKVFTMGLRSKKPFLVAKSVRQLAFIAPDAPQLAEMTKGILRDFTNTDRVTIPDAFLALQALKQLGPDADALAEVADMLSVDEVMNEPSYAMYTMMEPLPGWNSPFGFVGGMGGFGGGISPQRHLLPLILQILPTYGEAAKAVLPQLLGYYSNSGDQSNEARLSIKTTLLKIDNALQEAVLVVLCQDDKYESVNAFGEFCGSVKDRTAIPSYPFPADYPANTVDNLRSNNVFDPNVVWIAAALTRTPGFEDMRLSFKTSNQPDILISSKEPAIELRWPKHLACHPNVMKRCIEEASQQLQRQRETVKFSSGKPMVIDLVPIADQVEKELAEAQVRRQQHMSGGMF